MFRWMIALAAGALPLTAQNISASLAGTVEDKAGARMAGAAVSLTNHQTGFMRSSRTNESGFFSFPDLQPGAYTLTLTAEGFKRYAQSGIELNSGDQRSLGAIVLELGQVNESVTVTAEVNPVMLSSGERSGVLTGQEIEGMAIRGRDFMDAVGLLPGIVDTSDGREAPSADSIGGLYIQGGRSNSKNMTIDGISNLDTGSNGSVHTMPSLDSIGEVKVLMSNFSAEHGRNSGGVITVISRGGGKRFHGSLGAYHRHESYSANNYFNNRNGLARPPYRYNIFSYTVNGPVYIPGKWNRDRSRVFFFWSQEFQQQKVNYGTRTVTVPTAAERGGDFSGTRDVNSRLVPVYDPLAESPNGTPVTFPGNVIPGSRLHPVGRAVLNLFPEPNFVDPAPIRRYQWNYISSLSGAYPRHTESARIDYSPRQNLITYLRINNSYEEQHSTYGVWVNGSLNFPLTPIEYRRPGRGATLNATYTISPSFFTDAIFGVSQNKLYFSPEFPERVSRQSTGVNIPQWNPDLNAGGLLPNMTFASVPNYANPSMNNGVPYYNSNTIFSFVQNFSKVAGGHVVKFGAYLERTRKDQSASADTRGLIRFDRDRNNPFDSNYAYSNALLGYYTNYAEATARPQGHYRFTNFEWYVQDNWRVHPRLSLDYGVRFYRDLPQYDARNQLATFVPGAWDPATAPVLLRPGFDAARRKVAVHPVTGEFYREGLIGTYAPGVGDPAAATAVGGRNGFPRGLYTVSALAAAPRFGFAWDPFGRQRTAIRGGGGVYFDRIQGNPTMGTVNNPPTIFTPSVYYGHIDSLAQTAGQGILAPSASVTALLGHHKPPTTYNFSFGVQQQLGRTMMLDISYAGALSRHQLWQRNINPVPIGANHLDVNPQNRDLTTTNRPLPPNFLRPYQGYGDIFLFEFASTTNYNSLQASLSRRLANGISFGLSYTFSKALGSAATDTTRESPFFDPRRRNYGPLAYDRTHVLSLRYNYSLPHAPGRGVLNLVTRNWELAGITRGQSGAPFTPGYSLVNGIDITGTPSEGARVVVLDPAAAPLTRFAPPVRGTFGNAGVGVLRGPGFLNFDASLYRVVKIAERRTLQLRLETYNTPNHPQFSSISQTARFDPTGAQIDPLFLEPTAARNPRRLQFALRFNW